MGCLEDADICFPIWKTTSTGCEGEPLIVNPLGLRSSDLRNRDSGLKGAQRIDSSLSRRALSSPDGASNLLRISVTSLEASPKDEATSLSHCLPPMSLPFSNQESLTLLQEVHSPFQPFCSPLCQLPSQSWKPWQQEGVARETGLPSNQEFPASVSG